VAVAMVTEDCIGLLDALAAAEVRQQTSHGAYFRQLVADYGVSYWWFAQFAARHRIRSRNCHWPRDDRAAALRAVEVEGLSIREAARATGLSRTTIHRIVQTRRQRLADATGGIKFESKDFRCPHHGRITVVPCPACQAEAYRQSK
jgi:transposase-like protein